MRKRERERSLGGWGLEGRGRFLVVKGKGWRIEVGD